MIDSTFVTGTSRKRKSATPDLCVRLIVSRIDRLSTIRQRLFRNSSDNRHGGKLLKHTLLILTVVMLAVSLIAPIYPHEQTLQHAPTVIAILAMAMDTRRNWLSPVSFTCVAIFLWLHILGARYIYSFVPYDDWAINLTGKSISDLWDWKRNQYDRIVHFLFGCLCIAPAAETALKYGRLSWPWAVAFAMLTVLSVSALYEIFEGFSPLSCHRDMRRHTTVSKGISGTLRKTCRLRLLVD